MSTHYDSINKALFRRIPATAKRVLDIGCDTGLMGAALKSRNPECYVVGIEVDPSSAKIAQPRLDEVHVLNIEDQELDALKGGYDAILFGDVLEHLYDPEHCLRRIRSLLAKRGRIYACIPNIQHYSVIKSILRGDFQYQKLGILDRTHIRFYTLTNIFKMFLDGGYIPKKTGRLINDPNPFSNALGDVVEQFGFSKLNLQNLNTFQYLIEAAPMPPVEPKKDAEPMTFVVCSNDGNVLATNFLASPIFQDKKHQIIVKNGMSSAADGYNRGFDEAVNPTIVFAHQDVYFPVGWDQRINSQIQQITQLGITDWVSGCIGYYPDPKGSRVTSGIVIDRDATLLYTGSTDPSEVQTLDELMLVMPASSKLRFDPSLGFHFYGSDICLQNLDRGGKNYSGYAPCVHNSQLYKSEFPEDFHKSAEIFSEKWRSVPTITTSCKKFVNSK